MTEAALATEHLARLGRCPWTGGRLRGATKEELDRVRALVESNSLKHVEGSRVRGTVDDGLISADGTYFYPVHDDIAILLPGLAIVLDEARVQKKLTGSLSPEKRMVQDFYESLGWRRENNGFVDTTRGTDTRAVSAEYMHRCLLRPYRCLPTSGDYLLDAASGPIPHEEHLDGQDGFDFRVCVDLSLQALRLAKARLGNRGVYILGDVTNLPLGENSVDAAVSFHTIYHVPADEQITAIQELHRVIKPGATAVIAYSWGHYSKLMRSAFLFHRIAGRVHRIMQSLRGRHGPAPKIGDPSEPTLYIHPHSYRYFVRQDLGFPLEIKVWSSISKRFLTTFVHERLCGRSLLRLIYWLEDRFPYFAGRFGQYPLFIVRKTPG